MEKAFTYRAAVWTLIRRPLCATSHDHHQAHACTIKPRILPTGLARFPLFPWPQTRSSQWAQIPFSALLKHPVASECPRAWEPHSLSLITGLGTPNQTTPKFCLYKQPCPVVEQTWDPQSYGASFLWGHQLLGMVLQPQRVAQQILPEPGLQEHQLTFLC